MLAEELGTTVADVRKAISASGQSATGRTAQSLEARVKSENGVISGQLLGRPYAWALETGSRPARKKGTEAERQAFIRQLYEWCRARGLPDGAASEEQRLRFAKFLKWHINKYGTRLYRRGGRKDVITPSLQRLEREVPPRVGSYYVSEIMAVLDGAQQTNK